MNGRPLILNWEVGNVPAILEVWTPGFRIGNAILKFVFGLCYTTF